MSYEGSKGSAKARIGYSKENRQIEVLIPRGTPAAAVAQISDRIFADALKRLPRACPGCYSGDVLIIREELEDVIGVELPQRGGRI